MTSSYNNLLKHGHKPLADSTLKNMTKQELVSYIRCLEHNWSAAIEMNENQYKLLKQKDGVYKWHDLRENPNDLPKYTGSYDVTIEDDEDRFCLRAWFNAEEYPLAKYLDRPMLTWQLLNEWYDLSDQMQDLIIAWKQINTFRGE